MHRQSKLPEYWDQLEEEDVDLSQNEDPRLTQEEEDEIAEKFKNLYWSRIISL